MPLSFFLFLPRQRRGHKALKQGMGPVGAALELRVELAGNKPRMLRNYNHLDDTSIWGESGKHHSIFLKYFTVIVINFVTVTMSFLDLFAAIKLVSLRILVKDTWVGTKTKCSS